MVGTSAEVAGRMLSMDSFPVMLAWFDYPLQDAAKPKADGA